MDNTYDYIFVGWGLASSALILAMNKHRFFVGSRILIIDSSVEHPQQTRSSWFHLHTTKHPSIPLRQRNTTQVSVGSRNIQSTYQQYRYCSVLSQDRRDHVTRELADSQLSIVHIHEEVTAMSSEGSEVIVTTNADVYRCKKVFNSSLRFASYQSNTSDIIFSQKFVGACIQTSTPVFDAACPTLMDFQHDGKEICFVYILPYSSTKALIEYTYFTNSKHIDEVYIRNQLNTFILKKRGEVDHIYEESGSIPMTNRWFNGSDKSIRHIGTAGGCTKPSSGYTFSMIMKDVDAIIRALLHQSPHRPRVISKRHRWYDHIMLAMMQKHPVEYPGYMMDLFRFVRPDTLSAFMNETSTLTQELEVIWALPKRPFIKIFLFRTFDIWKSTLRLQNPTCSSCE